MKPSDEYILKQPPDFQEILFYIISVVEKELSNTELLFKWGVPYFYYKKKPFCYLAPNKKRGYVDVGFAKGFQLTIHLDVLVGDNRNTVKSLRYYSSEEINLKILIEVIVAQKKLF